MELKMIASIWGMSLSKLFIVPFSSFKYLGWYAWRNSVNHQNIILKHYGSVAREKYLLFPVELLDYKTSSSGLCKEFLVEMLMGTLQESWISWLVYIKSYIRLCAMPSVFLPMQNNLGLTNPVLQSLMDLTTKEVCKVLEPSVYMESPNMFYEAYSYVHGITVLILLGIRAFLH